MIRNVTHVGIMLGPCARYRSGMDADIVLTYESPAQVTYFVQNCYNGSCSLAAGDRFGLGSRPWGRKSQRAENDRAFRSERPPNRRRTFDPKLSLQTRACGSD